MKKADLIFAVLPPVLAILSQWFPIPPDKYLAAKAAERQQRAKLPVEATNMILETTKGALVIANFIPTIVTTVISAFALLYDRENDAAEYFLILLIALIVISVITASGLSRTAPFELSTVRVRAPFGINGFLPFTWTTAINGLICIVNLALIALGFLKYLGYLPTLHFLHCLFGTQTC